MVIDFQKSNLGPEQEATAWASNMGCLGDRALLAISIQTRAKFISHKSEMLCWFPSFSASLLESPVTYLPEV